MPRERHPTGWLTERQIEKARALQSLRERSGGLDVSDAMALLGGVGGLLTEVTERRRAEAAVQQLLPGLELECED